jgi:hypothetical protein
MVGQVYKIMVSRIYKQWSLVRPSTMMVFQAYNHHGWSGLKVGSTSVGNFFNHHGWSALQPSWFFRSATVMVGKVYNYCIMVVQVYKQHG